MLKKNEPIMELNGEQSKTFYLNGNKYAYCSGIQMNEEGLGIKSFIAILPGSYKVHERSSKISNSDMTGSFEKAFSGHIKEFTEKPDGEQ